MNRLFLLIAVTAVLASAAFGQVQKGVKLKGQVVCSTCWFEAPDRKATPYGNAADIKCAAECAGEGVPQSLAVQDEKGYTLYTLEKGSYPMKGKDFLDLVPNVVEIEGDVRTEKDKRFVKVNSLKVLAAKAELPVLKSDDAVLALKDLTGTPQSLAGYRGRVVVLNFWATWCEPCKKEMPDLTAIQNDYAALGVQVIGAAGDAASDSAKVLKFIREYKLNFPVWLGGSTEDMARFGLGTVLPATVIIDKNGKIVWREVGVIKPVELRKELDRILLPTVAAAEKQAKADKPKSKNASLVPA
ncbi:MAG: TlpA disulfide reductase family protein [Pyrinomonadaceae bacterium]